METELKTETTLPSLDELFRSLGECDYLLLKTNSYLESLREERVALINLINEYHNGQQDNVENMGNEG
jgi:hypothetical protein